MKSIWLLESREEIKTASGEYRYAGEWYPCGWVVHRTKAAALAEGRSMPNGRPYRAVRYARANEEKK